MTTANEKKFRLITTVEFPLDKESKKFQADPVIITASELEELKELARGSNSISLEQGNNTMFFPKALMEKAILSYSIEEIN